MKTRSATIFIILGFALSIALILILIHSFSQRKATSQEQISMEHGLFVEPVKVQGKSYLIPPDKLYEVGYDAGDRPALFSPAFDTVTLSDTNLSDEVEGVDVAINNERRYYSYQILNWHEAVNDTIADMPILVSHCALCKSSAVYSRLVDGEERTFEVSGFIYQNNTVLRDRETGSLWLQATGVAISGPSIGQRLDRIPSTVVTWGQWKSAFSDGMALSVNTGHDFDYGLHPYGGYDTSGGFYFPVQFDESALGSKWIVYGVQGENGEVAFAKRVLEGFGAQRTTVDERPIVALYDFNNDVVRVFSAEKDGQSLTINYSFDTATFTDTETGSTWNAFGLAIDGELAGTQLERVPTTSSFWMCWSGIFEDTELITTNE